MGGSSHTNNSSIDHERDVTSAAIAGYLIDRTKCSAPAGVTAMSRGLSEATPPGMRFVIQSDAGGVAEPLPARPAHHSDQSGEKNLIFEACRISCNSGTPAG